MKFFQILAFLKVAGRKQSCKAMHPPVGIVYEWVWVLRAKPLFSGALAPLSFGIELAY